MPHYLYETEGLIIGSRPIKEGSRLLDLVTERLGRVAVLAQGARELRSKLRYRLSEFTFVRFTLVRGREFWRLVGTEPVVDFNASSLIADARRRGLIARLAFLLRRFLVANEILADRQLYAEIRTAVAFLVHQELSLAELEQYEVAAVWRLLAHLGYGRRTPTLLAILSSPDWNHDLLATTATCQTEAIASINEALYHSHL